MSKFLEEYDTVRAGHVIEIKDEMTHLDNFTYIVEHKYEDEHGNTLLQCRNVNNNKIRECMEWCDEVRIKSEIMKKSDNPSFYSCLELHSMYENTMKRLRKSAINGIKLWNEVFKANKLEHKCFNTGYGMETKYDDIDTDNFDRIKYMPEGKRYVCLRWHVTGKYSFYESGVFHVPIELCGSTFEAMAFIKKNLDEIKNGKDITINQ